MLGVIWRVILATAIGGAASLLAAANWSDPNSPAAGVIIGLVGTYGGFILGVIWAEAFETRTQQ